MGKVTFHVGKSFFLRSLSTMKNYEKLYTVQCLQYEKIFFQKEGAKNPNILSIDNQLIIKHALPPKATAAAML